MNGLVVVLLLMIAAVIAIYWFYTYVFDSEAADDRHRRTVTRGRERHTSRQGSHDPFAASREQQEALLRQQAINEAKGEFKRYLDGLDK